MAKGTKRGRRKVEMKKAQNEEQSQDKYQNQSGLPHIGGHPVPEQSTPKTNQERLDRELLRMEKMVANEKNRGKMLDLVIEARKGKYWWEAPIENLDLNQLQELQRAHQALYDDISKQLGKTSTFGQVPSKSRASLIDDFIIMGRFGSNQMDPFDSKAPPAIIDGFPNASIPYLVNRISSLNAGEGSSNTVPGFDGVVQSEGSLRTNVGAPEEMIASTSSSNLIDSIGTKKKN